MKEDGLHGRSLSELREEVIAGRISAAPAEKEGGFVVPKVIEGQP